MISSSKTKQHAKDFISLFGNRVFKIAETIIHRVTQMSCFEICEPANNIQLMATKKNRSTKKRGGRLKADVVLRQGLVLV